MSKASACDPEVGDLPPRTRLTSDLAPDPIYQSIAANVAKALVLLHASTADADFVDVSPALSRTVRGMALSLVAVGHFARAPRRAVDTAHRTIEALAARDRLARATPWQRALITIFEGPYALCGQPATSVGDHRGARDSDESA